MAEPKRNACSPVKSIRQGGENQFLLIDDGGCGYYEKVCILLNVIC